MSEPVGPQYGLEPRKKPIDPPDYTSRDLVSDQHYSEGSEFAGVGGIIAPPPHVPTANERRQMVYAIDPTDPGDDPSRGSIPAPELEGDFQ